MTLLEIPNGAWPLHSLIHDLLACEVSEEVFVSLCQQRTHSLSPRIENGVATLFVALYKGREQQDTAIALLTMLELEFPVLRRQYH